LRHRGIDVDHERVGARHHGVTELHKLRNRIQA
jgi:hypothetical protein